MVWRLVPKTWWMALGLVLGVWMGGPGGAQAGLVEEGVKILEARCATCHNLTGPAPQTLQALWSRKGPDLFYAGIKYKQDWLEVWLQDPRRIRPAGMFYGNHIRPGQEGDEIDPGTLKPHPRLAAEEARAVAAALMTYRALEDRVQKGVYKPGHTPKRLGELMFTKFKGCIACHEIRPGFGGLSGPELYTAARRLQEDYLFAYIQNPQAFDPKIFMPRRPMKPRDVQRLIDYLRKVAEEVAP